MFTNFLYNFLCTFFMRQRSFLQKEVYVSRSNLKGLCHQKKKYILKSGDPVPLRGPLKPFYANLSLKLCDINCTFWNFFRLQTNSTLWKQIWIQFLFIMFILWIHKEGFVDCGLGLKQFHKVQFQCLATMWVLVWMGLLFIMFMLWIHKEGANQSAMNIHSGANDLFTLHWYKI